MSNVIGIIVGFIFGFLSCYLFWRFQLTVRPVFLVSSKVTSRPNRNDPARKVYQIKIVNLSSRPIINMRAKLGVHELRLYERGHRRPTIYNIEMSPSSSEAILGPKKKAIDPWSITNIHYYTARPDKIIEDLLTGERKLVFTIQATDATSNTTIIRRYTYNKEDIVEGKFEPGDIMEIVPLISH